jgi:hypothetical protein
MRETDPGLDQGPWLLRERAPAVTAAANASSATQTECEVEPYAAMVIQHEPVRLESLRRVFARNGLRLTGWETPS